MRAIISTIILRFLVVFVAPTDGALITSTVVTQSGVVAGTPRSQAGVLQFLGIPYAAGPVGSLRWRPPTPAPNYSGTLNATSYGASCYAAEENAPVFGVQSEDCLNLNVWTAANDTTQKLPVMVWIYGGGFQFGSSSQPNYNGTNFARESVILVSFNYRLGVLGFLALPELDQEGTNSGNFGLQDQVAAMHWVKANIAQFGGDPDNVTIFGESAGAHSVGLLLASNLTSGLFNKAILESGAYWDSEHGSIESFQDARQKGDQFEQKLGATTVAELRSLPATTINNAALWNSSTDPGITAFAPSIDNYVVTKVPAATFSQGQTQKIPILAGFNLDEEFLFLPRALPHSTTQQYAQSVDVFFAGEAIEALQLYPGSTQAQANNSADIIIGDLVIREQTWEALDSQARNSDQTCYGYYFTYTSAYSPLAAHTAEVSFVFGNLGPNPIFGTVAPPSSADVALSRTIMSYWTNFARTGNPNSGVEGLVQWPTYSSGGNNFLQIGNTITPIATPDLNRFEFLRSLRTNGALPTRWRSEFTNN